MTLRLTPKPICRYEPTTVTQSALRPSSALAVAGIRPRKSRGQNFLVQRRVAERIVAAAEIAPGDSLVEIGPGLGILTELIINNPLRQLTLVELDARLAASLESRFRNDSRVKVVNSDLLSLNIGELMDDAPFKVVGNLPFNIAGAMLEHLCSCCDKTQRMVLMFQREVAERIRARVGAREYSALSAFTAMYWDILAHFSVAAGSFHPRPRVDAEVLVFAPRCERKFEPQEERAVLATVRAAFSAPRKTIRNSLAGGLGIKTVAAEAGLACAGIEVSVRPANLAVADFVRLARALGPLVPLGIPRHA
jgi:16S rRNA (adenine1518-N6/adenine1519-N6)-dimethyltransferase